MPIEGRVRVMSAQLKAAPSREQRATAALQRGDQLLAQAIINGLEDPETVAETVAVYAMSDELTVQFTVPYAEAPHIGDEFVVTLVKAPTLGAKVAEL